MIRRAFLRALAAVLPISWVAHQASVEQTPKRLDPVPLPSWYFLDAAGNRLPVAVVSCAWIEHV